MQPESLYKITYGLYIVTSRAEGKSSGFISNSVMQVSSQPKLIAACCSKKNFTSELILSGGSFAITALKKDCSSEILGNFGFTSGRDSDKFSGLSLKQGKTGIPIVYNDALAVFECRLTTTMDLGTHLLFIGELVDAEIIDSMAEPLTYEYYREIRKGTVPENAPTYGGQANIQSNTIKHKCLVCGYIYMPEKGDPGNGIAPGTAFGELPHDWKCPVCSADKDDFIEI